MGFSKEHRMSLMNRKKVVCSAPVSVKGHRSTFMKVVCKPGDMQTRVMGAEIIGNVQPVVFDTNWRDSDGEDS